MFRSAALLVILAFILGLWIGMNPEARASAEEAVARADKGLAQVGEQAKVVVARLFGRVSEERPPASRPPVKPEPSNFLGQVTAAIEKIWLALKQLWLNLMKDTRKETQSWLAVPPASPA